MASKNDPRVEKRRLLSLRNRHMEYKDPTSEPFQREVESTTKKSEPRDRTPVDHLMYATNIPQETSDEDSELESESEGLQEPVAAEEREVQLQPRTRRY